MNKNKDSLVEMVMKEYHLNETEASKVVKYALSKYTTKDFMGDLRYVLDDAYLFVMHYNDPLDINL